MTPAHRSAVSTTRLARWVGLVSLLSLGCASTRGLDTNTARPPLSAAPTSLAAPRAVSLADQWGVQPIGIRLTAAGYMLDFRYRVVNAHKAAPLFNRRTKPLLIDERTGAQLVVPAPPKTGPLRSSNTPQVGRTYFMLFANPGRFLKPGSKVTVLIGKFKAAGLLVE